LHGLPCDGGSVELNDELLALLIRKPLISLPFLFVITGWGRVIVDLTRGLIFRLDTDVTSDCVEKVKLDIGHRLSY
jgi:hypothetical protein